MNDEVQGSMSAQCQSRQIHRSSDPEVDGRRRRPSKPELDIPSENERRRRPSQTELESPERRRRPSRAEVESPERRRRSSQTELESPERRRRPSQAEDGPARPSAAQKDPRDYAFRGRGNLYEELKTDDAAAQFAAEMSHEEHVQELKQMQREVEAQLHREQAAAAKPRAARGRPSAGVVPAG